MHMRAFALALALICTSASPRVLVPPPTLDTLQGAWLGGPGADEQYFRLEIDSSGRGLLIAQFFAGERPAAYEVLSTTLTNGAIQFDLWPKGNAQPIYLRGVVPCCEAGMELEVGIPEYSWKRKILLERERYVLSRIKAVTERAHEISARSP